MINQLEQYLLDAQGKSKEELAQDNPYRKVGFDGGKKRLGWLKITPFVQIQDSLNKFLPLLEGKESFVFVGMGGSINGVKALLSIFNAHKIFTLDSLDPAAFDALFKKIENFDKTLIISISKSGTTQETQLLSKTLRKLYGDAWQKHFLWLSDPQAFEKLDLLSWQGAHRESIQFDGQSDIGGRFSCPHTLIFFFPLFLLLGRNFKKLKQVYDIYLSHLGEARAQAYSFADKYKNINPSFFFPQTDGHFGESFYSWIVQLFQESLGSKKDGFSVKTACQMEKENNLFFPLKLQLDIKSLPASLMVQMYFFQVFIAFYSAFKDINFVDQDFVEKYKQEMRKLEGSKVEDVPLLKLKEIIDEAKKKMTPGKKFIEVVLFFYPSKEAIDKISNEFSKEFSDKIVFVFIGSDWNHHSYQAAFSDTNTFYIFLLAQQYNIHLGHVPAEILQNNVEKLQIISKATYLTLTEKSLLSRLAD